jgi:hypothetical protein
MQARWNTNYTGMLQIFASLEGFSGRKHTQVDLCWTMMGNFAATAAVLQ